MEAKLEKKGSMVLADAKADKRVYPVGKSEYKLLEEIGRGVSAIVYRAKCISFNDWVAIKTLDLERCNSSLDDIRREAQIMSLINHPNVVKAYCSFVVERSLWVVMPYLAGGSCLNIMKAAYPDGFEEPIIASFLKETLKALEYLHFQGHIHRDVKAGNILVDGNGAVKLGDFGVSACMFDAGDRQRARNTFAGTPCWMAPEVMEQVHGYDFKADIWSFGITALELAHGHAPFSKYPPMKVLLMTLQNAPPGLDYERDKRFSKSFKEMIAMCLVKEPTKRPSAEKLLKHSFFKQARPADYVVRTILASLKPLWDRVNEIKDNDAARLAQKKMPYVEQEERSQNEYKRGVSAWNFDLEDLKTQAALDNVEPFSGPIERFDTDCQSNEASSPTRCADYDADTAQLAARAPTTKLEIPSEAGDHAVRARSGSVPAQLSSNGPKLEHALTGKKEPKHIGRFDVFEDDPDQDGTDPPGGNSKSLQQETEEEVGSDARIIGNGEVEMEENILEIEKEGKPELVSDDARVHEQEHSQRAFSGALVADFTDDVREGDSEARTSSKVSEDNVRSPRLHKDKSLSGPVPSSGTGQENQSSLNGASQSRPSSAQGQKDEDKLKGLLVQKKGRFSVTSHDMESQEGTPTSNSWRNASAQTSALHKSASVGDVLLERKGSQLPTLATSQSFSASVSSGLNATSVIPHLQNLFNQTAVQQELILNLMTSICPSEHMEKSGSLRAYGGRTLSRSSTMSSVDSMGEFSSEREKELLTQIADLQSRVAASVDELQAVKYRNVQLERQLNTIFNKEEEERIRREEAARDDG